MTSPPAADKLAALARFAASCPLSAIPEPVREHARGLILDQLGVGLIGSRQQAYTELVTSHTRLGLDHAGPALVLAAGGPRRSPYTAALRNAAAAHLSELGEGVSRAVVHVSNAVVPAALARADSGEATGAELLRAVAVSCEVMIRFGLTVNSPPGAASRHGDVAEAYLAGWWTPIVLAPIGSATVWTLLSGGNADQLSQAWLTALNCAPAACVPFILGGGPGKGLGMGLGCAAGIAAADLAGADPASVGQPAYDPVTGWLPLLASQVNEAALTNDLADRWELDYPLYKYIATVGPLHAAVEAVFEIQARQPIDHRRVTGVKVAGYQRTVQFLGRPQPTTAEEAKTSLVHTLAAAIVTGDRQALLHDAFEAPARADPDIARIAGLVEAAVHPPFDAAYPHESACARVTITMADGQTHTAEVDRDALPRYHRPSRNDLTEKFVAATSFLLDHDPARELAELVWGIEAQPRASQVTDVLAGLLTRPHPGKGPDT